MSEEIAFFSKYTRLWGKDPAIGRKPLKSHVFSTLFDLLPDDGRTAYLEAYPQAHAVWSSQTKDAAILSILSAELTKPRPRREIDEQFFRLIKHRGGIRYIPSEDILDTVDLESYRCRMTDMLGKDDAAAWLAQNTRYALKHFTPWAERITVDPKTGDTLLNFWGKPHWANGYNYESKNFWSGSEPHPGADTLEFFKHLFPHKPDRVHVFAWLRKAIFSRCPYALCLYSNEGTGKNTVYDILGWLLDGENADVRKGKRHYNVSGSQESFTKSFFLSNITQSQVFALDEIVLDSRVKNLMKRYLNDTATVEEKGVTVGAPESMVASFINLNNHPEQNIMVASDRRFFVPKVTNKKLLSAWDQDRIDKFRESWLDPERCKNFCHFLYSNIPDIESSEAPKTETFYRLCVASYPHWFRQLFEKLKTQGSFNFELYDKATYYTVLNMVDMYEQRHNIKICNIENDLITKKPRVRITSLIKDSEINIGEVQ